MPIPSQPSWDFEDIRRLTVTALFSDDVLFDRIVLKGGNAMRLVHGLTARTSLDLDFSLESDFGNLDEVRERMERALAGRFGSVGLVPFDVTLQPKPMQRDKSRFLWWGGYELKFKLVEEQRYDRLRSNLEQLRREAAVLGPNQLRTFTVDLSKCEYTQGKARVELDSYEIFVYPPAMIALEKLRAICQQMKEYAPIGRTRRPRARDFFDIHNVISKAGVRFDAPGNADLIRAIFAAKQVPLSFLGNIGAQREFHRTDWPSVQATTSGELREFDYYFDFVLRAVEPLQSLWVK